jgi:hypothetical protein
MSSEKQLAMGMGGSPAEQGRYIDTLVAEGRLSPERVAMAAGLFHAGARCSQVKPQRFAKGYRGRLTAALEVLPDKTIVEFAVDCAERVFPFWEAFRASDQRVGEALRLCRRWLESSVERRAMSPAQEAATACLTEVDESLNGEEPDVPTACAMAAASAASSSAAAAAAPTKSMSAMWGGSAAKAAANGAADYLAEVQWQVDRLTSMLLDPSRR